MQYTRPMIELVYHIRRIVPEEFKHRIKLADPELLNFLRGAYSSFDDQSLRSAVATLLELAGPNWAINSPGSSQVARARLVGAIERRH